MVIIYNPLHHYVFCGTNQMKYMRNSYLSKWQQVAVFISESWSHLTFRNETTEFHYARLIESFTQPVHSKILICSWKKQVTHKWVIESFIQTVHLKPLIHSWTKQGTVFMYKIHSKTLIYSKNETPLCLLADSCFAFEYAAKPNKNNLQYYV